MRSIQFSGTATQPHLNRKNGQFNNDQYCIQGDTIGSTKAIISHMTSQIKETADVMVHWASRKQPLCASVILEQTAILEFN